MTSVTAADQAFRASVEACTLPGAEFTHRAHVRLAWIYASTLSEDAALLAMEQTLRRYAGSLGAAQKYNHAITTGWMQVVTSAIRRDAPETFEAFVERCPHLLDKHLALPASTAPAGAP